ncbi:MAG: metallophosphoesterase [Thermoplasmata archaeon]
MNVRRSISFIGRKKIAKLLGSLFMLIMIILGFVLAYPISIQELFQNEERNNFSIIIFGDVHHGEKEPWHDTVFEEIVNEIRSKRPDFSVITGDMISAEDDNTKNCTKYYGYILGKMKSTTRAWYAVEGNHDVETEEGRLGFKKYISEREYFAVDKGDILFVFLSTEIEGEEGFVGDTQLDWLETVLKNSTEKYKFIFLHRPPFDYSSPDVYPNGHGWLNLSLRDRFSDLVSETNVTAVFSGHQHMYRHKVVGNVHYITTGAAGGLYNSSQGHYGKDGDFDGEIREVYVNETRYQIPTTSMVTQGVFYNYIRLEITDFGPEVSVYRADAPFNGSQFYLYERFRL